MLTVKFALKAVKIAKKEVSLQENQVVSFFITFVIRILFLQFALNNYNLQ